jgi:hypothetical protein
MMWHAHIADEEGLGGGEAWAGVEPELLIDSPSCCSYKATICSYNYRVRMGPREGGQ